MNHQGYLFDFPGRGYEFQHADLDSWFAAALVAVRAIVRVVEPTVIEATVDESREVHHLVCNAAPGGAYLRDPARTVSTDVIDEARLVTWLENITRRGTLPITHLSIADGWYFVDAPIDDVITLRNGNSSHRITVIGRNGATAILAPSELVRVPPIDFRLDSNSGTIEAALHWSPWIDSDGVGRKRFDRMCKDLSAAGWKLGNAPSPRDLDWRSWTPEVPIVPLPTRTATRTVGSTEEPAWLGMPAARVVLGLSVVERERLVDRLLVIDRQAAEAEQSFGYHEYPTAKRREEIRAGLSTSLGHAEIEVAAYEIMREPVTNEMWQQYMNATGAARPTSWPASGLPTKGAPVTGISRVEAAAFATHHGWALPSEAEWELAASEPFIADGYSEYTRDLFAPYPRADIAAFAAVVPDWEGQICARGNAPKVPSAIPARRGLARDHRFKFARFRCVRKRSKP